MPLKICFTSNSDGSCTDPVAARFVTTARFVSKVRKRAAVPARFVTNEVVTNRAGIAPFFLSFGYQYM